MSTRKPVVPSPLEVTWAQFDEGLGVLCARIRRQGPPDVVLGVMPGGVYVGRALAQMLECSFWAIRLGARSRDRGQAEPMLPLRSFPTHLRGKRVLVVDDVAGSGASLKPAVTAARRAAAQTVHTCALVRRPDGYSPDFCLRSSKQLHVFPWDYPALFGQAPWEGTSQDEQYAIPAATLRRTARQS